VRLRLVALRWEAALRLEVRPLGPGTAAACRTEAPAEIVRTVVSAAVPLRLMEEGVKRQAAPEGRPPVQAKVMVEWKPPVGIAVSVMGLEILPRVAVAEVVVRDSVKAPEGARMVSITAAEVSA